MNDSASTPDKARDNSLKYSEISGTQNKDLLSEEDSRKTINPPARKETLKKPDPTSEAPQDDNPTAENSRLEEATTAQVINFMNSGDKSTEKAESEKSEIGKLSLIDLMAASAAAATATVIGGKLGVAGTVIGAALASAVCTIAAASYKTLGYKAKDVAKTALPGSETNPSVPESSSIILNRKDCKIFKEEIATDENPTAESLQSKSQNTAEVIRVPDSLQLNDSNKDGERYVLTYTVSMLDPQAPLQLKISETANPLKTALQDSDKNPALSLNRLLCSLARNWERIILLILLATIIGISAILIPERISGQAWTPGTSDLQSRVGPSFPAYREIVVSKPTVTVVTQAPESTPTPRPTVTVTITPTVQPTTAPKHLDTSDQPKNISETANDESKNNNIPPR